MVKEANSIVKEVLKHVGIVKHQLLVFAILGTVTMNYIAHPMWQEKDQTVRLAGVFLSLASVPLILGSALGYFYLLIRFPGSVQEMEFSKTAEKQIKDHRVRSEQ